MYIYHHYHYFTAFECQGGVMTCSSPIMQLMQGMGDTFDPSIITELCT